MHQRPALVLCLTTAGLALSGCSPAPRYTSQYGQAPRTPPAKPAPVVRPATSERTTHHLPPDTSPVPLQAAQTHLNTPAAQDPDDLSFADADPESDTAPAVPPAPDGERLSFYAQGVASYYGKEFNGRKTASGERFDMHQLTAAHRTLPFGTRLRVTSLANGKSVTVRINDRGPVDRSRIIDLSQGAAAAISLDKTGIGKVRLELIR